MRKLVTSVIAALIAGPAIFVGTATAAEAAPVFHCYLEDEGPESFTSFAVVPSAEYPRKSDAKKAGYVRCFAQGHQGG